MSQPDARAIPKFWIFWEENERAIERAIRDRAFDLWIEPIGQHVSAIDERLDWEMGKGLRAEHYFCLSGKGDPTLRVLAERWRSAGPGDGSLFEFHAARPAGGFGDFTLDFGEVGFAVRDFRVRADVDASRERVHVEVWHPSFANAPSKLPATATFIALDSVLGEDGVERWIGGVRVAERPLDGGVDLGGLAQIVDRVAAGATGHFAILEGKRPSGGRVVASVNLALKRVDHLLMDTHVEVVVQIAEPTPDGMTTQSEAHRLNAGEDELADELDHDAVYIGRETAEGKRTLHFHVAALGPALARIEAWGRRQPWHVSITSVSDPAWDVLRRW